MKFTVIDFETANATSYSACSIGIVRIEELIPVERKHFLIRPPDLRFSPFNIKIHGITPDAVINQPRFDQLWPYIRDMFEDTTLVMHYASFDIRVLQSLLDFYSLPYPQAQVSCTWVISQKVWPDLSNHRLDSVAAHLGINFLHHNALEDAMACYKIAAAAFGEHKVKSWPELEQKLGFRNGFLSAEGYQPVRYSVKTA